MDFKKALGSAKMIIVISLVFNLVMICIGVVLGILGFGASAAASQIGLVASLGGATLITIVSWGVKAIVFLGNIAIIVYGGHRAAKRGNDLMTCGMVGLVTYALVGLFCGVINLVLGFFGIGAALITSGSAMTGLFSGLLGAASLGMGLVCGVIWYVLGLVTNFLVALAGGMIGGAK